MDNSASDKLPFNFSARICQFFRESVPYQMVYLALVLDLLFLCECICCTNTEFSPYVCSVKAPLIFWVLFSENVGLLGSTRVGSRRVIQISAGFMIFFSMLGSISPQHSTHIFAVFLGVLNLSWLQENSVHYLPPFHSQYLRLYTA